VASGAFGLLDKSVQGQEADGECSFAIKNRHGTGFRTGSPNRLSGFIAMRAAFHAYLI